MGEKLDKGKENFNCKDPTRARHLCFRTMSTLEEEGFFLAEETGQGN